MEETSKLEDLIVEINDNSAIYFEGFSNSLEKRNLSDYFLSLVANSSKYLTDNFTNHLIPKGHFNSDFIIDKVLIQENLDIKLNKNLERDLFVNQYIAYEILLETNREINELVIRDALSGKEARKLELPSKINHLRNEIRTQSNNINLANLKLEESLYFAKLFTNNSELEEENLLKFIYLDQAQIIYNSFFELLFKEEEEEKEKDDEEEKLYLLLLLLLLFSQIFL